MYILKRLLSANLLPVYLDAFALKICHVVLAVSNIVERLLQKAEAVFYWDIWSSPYEQTNKDRI